MSSSDPNSYIALTDSEKDVEDKIKKYAFSGGQPTLKEHREKGGNPETDISFQYLKLLFEAKDTKLKSLEEDYKSGKLLTGELKEITIEKINSFLRKHKIARKKAEKEVSKFLD